MTNLKSLIRFMNNKDETTMRRKSRTPREEAASFFLEFETALRYGIDHARDVFNRHTSPLKVLETYGDHVLIGIVRSPHRVTKGLPRYSSVFRRIRFILAERHGEERMLAMMVGLDWPGKKKKGNG